MSSKKPSYAPHGVPDPESVISTAPKPPRKTKLSLLVDLISRKEGATLVELTSATGWLPHTARASISALRKRGHDVSCKRVNGVSRYNVGPSAQ